MDRTPWERGRLPTADFTRIRLGLALSSMSSFMQQQIVTNSQLVADGDEALEPYIFDYILLCNKICGTSHYNMQMKIIVETPEAYEAWMSQQQTFAQVIQ